MDLHGCVMCFNDFFLWIFMELYGFLCCLMFMVCLLMFMEFCIGDVDCIGRILLSA